MFLYLVPVLGLGTAMLAFGERVKVLEVIGVLATLGGIGVVAREFWRQRELAGNLGNTTEPKERGEGRRSGE